MLVKLTISDAGFLLLLYRADLATGVVELDSTGTITHSTALPLYPPGLLFGAPEASLLGSHISSLLPQVTPGTPVTQLFEPGFGGTLAPVSMQEAMARWVMVAIDLMEATGVAHGKDGLAT
jgi:hypothetical protein